MPSHPKSVVFLDTPYDDGDDSDDGDKGGDGDDDDKGGGTGVRPTRPTGRQSCLSPVTSRLPSPCTQNDCLAQIF